MKVKKSDSPMKGERIQCVVCDAQHKKPSRRKVVAVFQQYDSPDPYEIYELECGHQVI